MYKQANQLKLRFTTKYGEVNVERLFEIPLTELDKLAIELEEEYKQSGKKSFLVSKSRKDKIIKLKFDIVIDVLNTKLEERDAAIENADKKAFNQKILSLIEEKKEEELKGNSLKDLEKMLK